jgi:hypothetical protein
MYGSKLWSAVLPCALFSWFCAACGAELEGARFSIQVAPLGLEDLDKVCWDLAVENQTGVIWQRGDPKVTAGGGDQDPEDGLTPNLPDTQTICSDRYGSTISGGITFIGTCDMRGDTNPSKAGVQNRVRLWVDGLYPGEPAEGESLPPERNGWNDPCPEGCATEADCVENADTRVDINLSILRETPSAVIAATVEIVKYESCAAVYSSCMGTEPRRLLLGLDGIPDTTAVFSFGCFFRDNAPSPQIFYDSPTITCDQGTATLLDDVVFELATQCANESLGVSVGGTQLEYRITNQNEPEVCGVAGGSPCDAATSTFAVNTSTLAPHKNCRIEAVATIAAVGDFVSGLPVPALGLYPFMVLDAQLTDATGAHVCIDATLDEAGGSLTTEYWGPLSGVPYSPMCSLYEPGDVTMGPTGACAAQTCEAYVSSSCLDGVTNGSETDIDCGGSCTPCEGGETCFVSDDCESGVCEQETFTCVSMPIGPEVIGGVTVYSVIRDSDGYRRWGDGTYAASCAAYRNGDVSHYYRGQTGSGRYRISPTGSAFYDVYCDMSSDGGGWTLVMKVDGQESTFAYHSTHWTTNTTVSPESVVLDDMEAKFQSFNDVGFNEVRVSMLGGGSVTFPKSASSMRQLMASGTYEVTAVPDSSWLGLIPGSSIQGGCRRQGVNVDCSGTRVRVGIVGDDQSDCSSCESRLGFGGAGTAGGQSGANTCGNEARNNGVGGNRSLRTMGFIFVR